jgi:hypothetical protein
VSPPGQRAGSGSGGSRSNTPTAGPVTRPAFRAIAVLGVALLFLSTRLALLLTRAPFYDELFTRWIVTRPWGGLLPALRLDSGPPLYYQLVRLLSSPGNAVIAGRMISLVASALTLLVLALTGRSMMRNGVVTLRRSRSEGHAGRIGARPGGLIAAILFAAFPAAVFASCDARSYALCAMFIALSIAALDRWCGQAESANPPGSAPLLFAVICLVLAAYSHDYGVLFFPIPFVVSLFSRRRRSLLQGLAASAACGLLFIPGFLLAMAQPRAAIDWMQAGSPGAPFAGLAFAARFPSALLWSPPAPLILLASALLALAIVRTGASERALRFATITLLPIAIVVLFGALRRPVYFPLRFDSIIAVPLVLWLEATLDAWSRPARWILTAGMVAIGVLVIAAGAIDHAGRRPDPYRAAALWARRSIDPRVTIVSSGYAWLEVWSARGDAWKPQLVAFPAEQADHPGWRANASRGALAFQRDRILRTSGDLVWIGERGPELRSLLEAAHLDVLHAEGPVAVARVIRSR